MSPFTSEKIAKSLKGAGLSAKERIDIAYEAWKDTSLFFPNKEDFLFDWITTAFNKANMKKADDCCILQLPYWTLLKELLIVHQNHSPILHVQFVQVLANLFQVDHVQLDLLKAVEECSQLIFSDKFIYRPSLDPLFVTVDRLWIVLNQQLDKMDHDMLHVLVEIARPLLQRFHAYLIQSANQKKVFTTLMERSFKDLLRVKRRIQHINREDADLMNQLLTDIVCHALFHGDTILEYSSVIHQQGRNNKYIVKLFDTLESMMKTQEEKQDATDVLPLLLSSFIQSIRQKQESTRVVEFDMFVCLLNILQQVNDPILYLHTLQLLLKELVHWKVYVQLNDEIAQTQQKRLNELAVDIMTYLKQEEYQPLVLEVADTLIQVDITLIEPRMNDLWPVLLNPYPTAYAACLKLSISILHAYTATRQLDLFIDEYIQHAHTTDIYFQLKQPLYSRTFRKEFSTDIYKHMPSAQATGIFIRFQQNLTPLISILFIEFINSLHSIQPRHFVAHLQTLYQDTILPQLIQAGPEVWTSLQLHTSLINTFKDTYFMEIKEPIDEYYKVLFDKYKYEDSLPARMIIVTTCNAIAQHIYCQSWHTLSTSSSLLDIIIDYITEDDWYQEASWTGSILDINTIQTSKLVCWKLLTDEWFETTCQYIDSDRAKKLCNLIYRSLATEHTSTDITAHSLNQVLMGSANFYEAPCFKAHHVSTLLSSIVALFSSVHPTTSLQTKLTDLITHMDINDPYIIKKETMVDLCNELVFPLTNEPSSFVELLQRHMSLFLMLPEEYFDVLHRIQSVQVCLLIDIWATTSISNGHIQLSTQCRTFYQRFIDAAKTKKFLKYDPRLMEWWMDSAQNTNSSALKAVTYKLDQLVLADVFSTMDTGAEWILDHRTKSFENKQKLINLFTVLNQYTKKHDVSPVVEKTRQCVIASLQHIRPSVDNPEMIRDVFHLARLLEEKEVNEELSNAIQSLSVPFHTYLKQAELGPTLMSASTEYVAALCSCKSPDTIQVLEFIWFVYELALQCQDNQSMETLMNAFSLWIQSLSKEEYQMVVDQYKKRVEQDGSVTMIYLLKLILFEKSSQSEKSYLKKQIASFVMKLSLMASKTKSLEFMEQLIELLSQLTSDPGYSMNKLDGSIILSALLQVAHPTANDRWKDQMTSERAHTIFNGLCTTLTHLFTDHKEIVVAALLPPVIALIQSLLHCFKSSQVLLIRKRKRDYSGHLISLFMAYAPFNTTAAERFSRMLVCLSRRVASEDQKNGQQLYKQIARYTPSILIEYFSIQSNPTMSIQVPEIKTFILNGLYDLLDMCSEADRVFIMACLDGSGKTLFKQFYSTWKETHQYTGQ
ncbi:Urb2/Npa2 family-domain-containing protein [Pilobolus umbonatus]|nr:Urb2/Npa2 family-domain-containing protein [Pilobolus umbonatus]